MGASGWTTTIRDKARAKLRGTGPCALCGLPIDYTIKSPDPMSFEVDHKKSRFVYPELAAVPSNWQPAHRKCNRAKSDQEYAAPIIRRSGALL